MRWKAVMFTLCSAEFLFAGQQMSVYVCNLGNVRESIIASAKAETEAVYRSAGVEIVWRECAEFSSPASQALEPWFVIRLRTDKPPRTVGPASLDVMGRAFVTDAGAGNMADAYYQAIEAFAERYQGDAGVLLGFVMAHENGPPAARSRSCSGRGNAERLESPGNGGAAPTVADVQQNGSPAEPA